VHRADWIAARLAPWEDEYTITIVVPAGFEAYARVLHPVETPENGNRLVRWADVAAWSAMPLRKDVQFHSIALPPTAPSGPPRTAAKGRSRAASTCRTPKSSPRLAGTGQPRRRTAGSACGTASAGARPVRSPL
jgi:hypothetical protein